VATLEDCFELLQKDVDFDMIGYRQKYASVIDKPPLLSKELHSLLESHKVPNDEMGKEMDNPCMEACFVCDALFEKNQGEAVKIPFCGHRAHIECLRRESTPICQFCGNGIRSSLYSSIKSTQLMEKTLNEANKQSNDENDALLDIKISHAEN
jgi:hypothetical protein